MAEHTESYVRLFTKQHRAEKQYRNPLSVGMTVRIVGEEYHGQGGEIKVIEPNFYGVYLDSVEDTVFFLRDEIERVENVDMAELPDLGQEGNYGDYRFSSLCARPERRAGHYQ